MELHQMLSDFRMESLEWIESMERALLHLTDTPGCGAAINDLFRAIPHLTRSAALFELDGVVVIAHAMESVLVRVCKGEVPSDETLVTLLLSCCEHIRTLIGQTSSDWNGKPHLRVEITEDALLGQLEGYRLQASVG